MNYYNLGWSSVNVSTFALGTKNLIEQIDEKDSLKMLNKAYEYGINFIDTANVYGDGKTEFVIGKWFKNGDVGRDEIILATKIYHHPDSAIRKKLTDHYLTINDQGLSARNIINYCEESLIRLNTDYIDILQLHHIDRNTLWEEISIAIDQLVHQGKIRYFGTSNFPAWSIVESRLLSQEINLPGPVSEQHLYNPLIRYAELEVIPACREFNIAFLVYSPLYGGVFTEERTAIQRKQSKIIKERYEQNIDLLTEINKVAISLNITVSQVVLMWLRQQDFITSIITGPRTLKQLEQIIEVEEKYLKEFYSLNKITVPMLKINKIFDQYKIGEAPEAYAW